MQLHKNTISRLHDVDVNYYADQVMADGGLPAATRWT